MIARQRKYTIIGYGEEIELNQSPKGWKDSSIDYVYSKKYRTELRSFQSQSLTFYFEGGAKLNEWFDSYMIAADAYLKIEELQDNYQYSLFAYGKFDFKSFFYNVDDESVSIDIDDVGDIVKFRNRSDMVVSMLSNKSIDGDTITPPSSHSVLLKKQDLLRTFDSELSEDRLYSAGESTETIEGATDSYNPPSSSDLFTVEWGFGVRSFGNNVSIGDYYKSPNLNSASDPVIELIEEPLGGPEFAEPIESTMVRPVTYNNKSAARIAMNKSIIRLEYKLTGTGGSKEFSIQHDIYTTRGEDVYSDPDSTVTFIHTGNNVIDPALPGYDDGWGFVSLGFNNVGTPDYVSLMGNDEIKLSSLFGFIQDNGDAGDLVLRQPEDLEVSESQQDYEFDVVQTTATENTVIDESLSPKTDELISNDFGSEITVPNQTSAIVLYKHSLPYSVVNSIDIEAGKILMSYTAGSIFYDIPTTATATLVHKDSENNIYAGHTITLYNTTKIVRPPFPYSFDPNVYEYAFSSVSEQWEFFEGDTLSFEMNVSFEVEKSNIIDLVISTGDVVYGSIVKSGFNFNFKDSAPADTLVDGYLFTDVLKQCMAVIVGEDKIDISAALTSTPSALNSLFGTFIMRGSMIRGVESSRMPMTCSFDDIFESMSRLGCLGLDYNRTTGRFEIDYLTNIYKKTSIDNYIILDVSNLGKSPSNDDIYKGVVAGDEVDSGVEGFHADRELHNKTEYATRISEATEYLHLETIISTNATEIELTRRLSNVEDKNFTKENDNKLFAVKCVLSGSDWHSEEDERIYFNENYENMAKTNLAFTPRIVIDNNMPLLASTFYNRSGDTLVFNSSKYIIDEEIQLDFNTDLYSEQRDILVINSFINNSIFRPISYAFDGLIDSDLLEQLRDDRHVVFDINGIPCYLRQVGANPFNRNTQFEAIVCNIDRL